MVKTARKRRNRRGNRRVLYRDFMNDIAGLTSKSNTSKATEHINEMINL